MSEEQRAREEELKRRRRDLPAGLDPEELEGGVAESARRGALRRRVRFLRAAREVLLRDLGGFYYEVHRTGRHSPNAASAGSCRPRPQRLADIDEELRPARSRGLGAEPAAATVVREPGIGGTCPTCGELHGSDAGWCWHCGTPLSDRARTRHEEEVDEAIAARQAAALEAEQARAAAAAAATADRRARRREHDGRRRPKTLAEYTSQEAARPQSANGGDAARPTELASRDRRTSPSRERRA